MADCVAGLVGGQGLGSHGKFVPRRLALGGKPIINRRDGGRLSRRGYDG
jgi:hypothetical protein